MMLLALLGCVRLPHCDALCEAQADCIEADLSAYGASWSEWTGRSDREAWVSACYAEFEASPDANGTDEVCEDEAPSC